MAHQTWFKTCAKSFDKDKTPILWTVDSLDVFVKSLDGKAPKTTVEKHLKPFTSGEPFLREPEDSEYYSYILENTHVSKCYSCNKVAIWIYGKLVYPADQTGPEPNPDIPDDILRDYQEASTILDLSPRGATALLRLCIQKICIHLGEKGKDLNKDIGSLVKKGLSPRMQKSLDTVRVIGNESVHPGQIDMKDDRETASKLFDLVNLIVDAMISQPKHIDALYEEKVPESKKDAIKKRDGGN